jgi:hypothetical protein
MNKKQLKAEEIASQLPAKNLPGALFLKPHGKGSAGFSF